MYMYMICMDIKSVGFYWKFPDVWYAMYAYTCVPSGVDKGYLVPYIRSRKYWQELNLAVEHYKKLILANLNCSPVPNRCKYMHIACE